LIGVAEVEQAAGRCLLALDLGTTSVRALVVSETGAVVGRAGRPLSQQYPKPGWLEQDPREFLRLAIDVMHGALDAAQLQPESVLGIGIVSQRSTAIAWDSATGEPLCPAIGWQDRRNQERVDELIALGIPINTLASATKFEWLLANDPATKRAADAGRLRLGTPDVWLTDRLSGGASFVTDPGHAACTGLYDPEENRWWSVALGLFGIEEAWLPEIVPTSAVVASTQPDLFGRPLPLAARAGDQQAASFAQGIYHPGMAKLTLGTSAMLNLHVEKSAPTSLDGFYALPLWSFPDGSFANCIEGTVITAGSSVEWLIELGLLSRAEQLDQLAGQVEDSQGLMFVPALQGLGSPFLDPAAKGLLLGLTRGSGPAHIARAVLEGVAHRCVDLCENLPLTDDPLRVDGGLARSDLLMASLSDLSGRSFLRAAESETTALGAAYLAGIATGVWSDGPEALATTRAPTRFEPELDPGARDRVRTRWREALSRCLTSR
jgi:glycerol kinase